MLTEAAKPLGFEILVVDPVENCPAAQVGAKQIHAGLKDQDAIVELAHHSDVITWEIEHIDSQHLIELEEDGHDIQPSPETLHVVQDKLRQRQMLAGKVPVGSFFDLSEEMPVDSSGFVVKSRMGGYDGRGNLVVETLDDPAIEEQFGDTPIYAETKIDFQKEIAAIAARDWLGNVTIYPLVETVQKNNICHVTSSPAELDPAIEEQSLEVVHATMGLLKGLGVFAIEMFVTNDGQVLVNEIAPRVHNSGHHTIEANITSQFEQHIRAITGLPLGSVESRSPSAMVNILGSQEGTLNRKGLEKALGDKDTHVHFYGKDPRRERKIGHITTLAPTTNEAKAKALKARRELYRI